MTTLLLSSRHTEDNQALWRAALHAGWTIERVRGLHLPEGPCDDEIVLYIEGLFAPAIAEKLGVRLIEPEQDWLARLPYRYRKREIRLATLGEARTLDEPRFVKPPNDKSFEAKVYSNGRELPEAFDDDMPILIAEPVEFEVEYRCFILNRAISTISPYFRHGRQPSLEDFAAPEEELCEAREFAELCLADDKLSFPRAVVLDVGRIRDDGWAVVEANAAWGSGIYGCDPQKVLQVIRHAVEPAARRK